MSAEVIYTYVYTYMHLGGIQALSSPEDLSSSSSGVGVGGGGASKGGGVEEEAVVGEVDIARRESEGGVGGGGGRRGGERGGEGGGGDARSGGGGGGVGVGVRTRAFSGVAQWRGFWYSFAEVLSMLTYIGCVPSVFLVFKSAFYGDFI